MSAGQVEGRVAFVTGAGSGIGRACALRLATAGAAVACVDIDGAAAEETARSCAGDAAVGLSADITSADQLQRAVEAAERGTGPIEIVVANAGIQGEGAAHELETERWDQVIGVNLTGQFLTVRSVLRGGMLARRGGSIVLTGSVTGFAGQRGLAAYAAAKGGVIALSRQLAIEYAGSGIRVNCTCPGTILTPLVQAAFEARGGDVEERLAARAAQVPLGRLGDPDDVAKLVLFLAGSEAEWITGQAYVVDGGITAALAPGDV